MVPAGNDPWSVVESVVYATASATGNLSPWPQWNITCTNSTTATTLVIPSGNVEHHLHAGGDEPAGPGAERRGAGGPGRGDGGRGYGRPMPAGRGSGPGARANARAEELLPHC